MSSSSPDNSISLYLCSITKQNNDSLYLYSIFFTISTYIHDYKNTISHSDFSIPTICQQFLEIRHKYGKAVKHLNVILSTVIICNFIPTTILFVNLFQKNSIDILSIISSVYFILSILCFHIILSKINTSISGIINIVDNNKYLRLFLERHKETYSLNIELDDLNNYNSNQLHFKNYLLEIENGDSIDWLILNNITAQKWAPFEILGYEWNNNNIIFRLLSLIILLWVGKDIL